MASKASTLERGHVQRNHGLKEERTGERSDLQQDLQQDHELMTQAVY